MGLLQLLIDDFIKTMSAKENTKLLHVMCVGYFYALAILSTYCCVFVSFPVIYRYDQDYNRNLLILIFIAINMIGNHILGSLYTSEYKNGVLLSSPPKNWILCLTCKQHCPPRAHHCPICQVCILKRDHHCYFFRTCVGIQNLRYFLPYSLYVGVGSFFCIKQLLAYLNYSYATVEFSISCVMSYIFPGVVYNYFWSGEGDLNFDKILCILVIYGCIVTGLGSMFYFLSELFMLCRGQTIHEFGKDIRRHDLGMLRNIKQVLWPWGILYFLIPLPVPTKEINAPWGSPTYIKGV